MSYSADAVELRRCTGRRRDGERCRAWALWWSPEQRCVRHSTWHYRVPSERTRYVPCRCAAYAWPHRPGGGFCRWPLAPYYRSTVRPGTHRDGVRGRFAALGRILDAASGGRIRALAPRGQCYRDGVPHRTKE